MQGRLSICSDWEFGHEFGYDFCLVVIDENLCGNLGVIQGRLNNIYYKS